MRPRGLITQTFGFCMVMIYNSTLKLNDFRINIFENIKQVIEGYINIHK